MKWRDAVHGCMVYTECAKMAAASSGSKKQTALQLHYLDEYSEHAVKNCSPSFRVACDKSAVSLLVSRE